MRWDLFFEDLEDQLASEWEAERAALDTEAERLRLSRVELRSRLTALAASSGSPSTPDESTIPALELTDGTMLSARIAAVGSDWVAATSPLAAGTVVTIVPLAAIRSVALSTGDVLRSARPSDGRAVVAERMSLGFVMRDIARRRVPVSLGMTPGRVLTGTIDRAGADHLDLAVHDPGSPRRASAVTSHRLVSFSALAWVRLDGATRVPLV